MLRSVTKNIPNSSFTLLSICKEDIKRNTDRRLKIVYCPPVYLILVVNPLAILLALLNRIELTSVSRWFINRNTALRCILESDVVVDMSGISFMDGNGLRLIYNVAIILPPILLKKKTVKFSQSMGPFNNPFNRFFAKLLLPRIDFIAARGVITKKYLNALGLTNVELCADGAFLMPVESEDKSSKDFFLEEKKTVGVNASSVTEKRCSRLGIDYVGILSQFVEYLTVEKNVNVLLIPHAMRSDSKWKAMNDMPTCEKIYGRIRNRRNCKLLSKDYAAEELRMIIGEMDFFIGSRIHSIVSSLSTKVPTISIGWGHKYFELLEQFDLTEYAIDHKDLTLQKLIDKFEICDKNRKDVRTRIEIHLADVVESAKKNIEAIVSLQRGEE